MSEWKPLSERQQRERLEMTVASLVGGGTVVSQGSTMVTIKYARPINHVLHAILSIFTCGLWLIVWAVLGISSKPPKYVRVWGDEYGRVMTDDGPSGEWVERMPAVQSAS